MHPTTTAVGLALVVSPHLLLAVTSGPALDKRAVIDSCLNSEAERSCFDLAVNCIGSVTSDVSLQKAIALRHN